MKKLESGRSMIEMLGVLAIIGVLSIGGLAGYTMAMNRHRANAILDYAQKCGVMVQTMGDGTENASSNDCRFEGMKTWPSGISAISAARSTTSGATTTTVKFKLGSASQGIIDALADRVGLSSKTSDTEFKFNVDDNTWS